MKLVFGSDIHGSASAAQNLAAAYAYEGADKLVLCGDLLYHGPRNDLPEDYNPKKVIEILNSMSDKIIAVRGNCDGEVDQMVLDFPVGADYTLIYADGIRMYVTHGHVYSPEKPMKLSGADVLISGHTHVLKALKTDGFYYVNPGSAALPKENNPKSYAVYENGRFAIKTFGREIIRELDAAVGSEK